jgi:hypothetical protein
MNFLELGCRGALVTVFALAAAGKVRSRSSWEAFVGSLDKLGLPTAVPARPFGALVVALEAAVPALLVIWPLGGFALALALLTMFSGALALTLARGQQATCRCFGASDQPIGLAHLVRNALLIALAVTGGVGAYLPTPEGGDLGGAIAAVLGGSLAGFLITRWDDLLFLFGASGPKPSRLTGR